MLLGGLGDLAVAVDDGGALAEGDRLARLALFLYFTPSADFPFSDMRSDATDNISHNCGVYLIQRMRLVRCRRRYLGRQRMRLFVTQKLLQGHNE